MGCKPPTTQNSGPFGYGGAARSSRATPSGERNEEFAPWLELRSFSASLASGAVAACVFGHGAAPAWGSPAAAREKAVARGTETQTTAAKAVLVTRLIVMREVTVIRAATMVVDTAEAARACQLGGAGNSADAVGSAGAAGGAEPAGLRLCYPQGPWRENMPE